MSKDKSNQYRDNLLQFLNEVTIVCPKCKKMAYVLTPEYTFAQACTTTLTCYHCKHTERKRMIHNLYFYSPRFQDKIGQDVIIIGTSLDPFFHQPLWYRKKAGAMEVWSYSPDHMKDLHTNLYTLKHRKFAAKERRDLLMKKIPKWMRDSAPNRNKALEILEGWFREGLGSRVPDQENKPSRKGNIVNTHMIGY
ncbi:MAG: hypothetical protein ACK5OS_05250 [Chryseotalea sp.]|jgi:hypothetical protein